ncbi:hypothetical protein FJY69_00140 [candidate division WOR-3 bacterium]|nr:hypothetical protein [candidate division WOR-3 bacterium]
MDAASSPSAGSEARTGSYCARSREERRGWISFLPEPSSVVVDALGLVLEAPEFLTGQGHPDAPVRITVPVIQPGIRTDRLLVAVDEAGGITLVGCPDEKDPGSAVLVAGDVLGLSGRLWRMPVEEFLALVEQPLGKSMAEAIHERAMPDWTDEKLLSGIAASLSAGRFPVVLVAAATDHSAREAFDYLNGFHLSVRLVGAAVYTSSGIEVAVPARLGAEVSVAPRPAADAPSRADVSARTTTGTLRPAQPQSGVARPAPARAGPAAHPTPTQPAATQPEPTEKPAPEREPEGPGPAPGSKPGVMAGKRPPPRR